MNVYKKTLIVCFVTPKILSKRIVSGLLILQRKKSSYFHQPGTEPLKYNTIIQLSKESVEKYKNREAVVDCKQNIRLTFEETDRRAQNIALGLIELGFKPGDRIGLWGPNTAEWFISSFAAAKAGLVVVDINPAYQSNELLFCIKAVKLKGILMDETFKTQNYIEILNQALPGMRTTGSNTPVYIEQAPYFTHVIRFSDKEYDGTYRLKDIETSFKNEKHLPQLERNLEEVQPDKGTVIQFTSGTTGSPKAALLSHFNLVNNALIVARTKDLFSKQHKICVQVPFFHIYGHVVGLLACFFSGSTLVIPSPSFKPEDSIEAIAKERCTGAYGTPTMFVDVLAKAKQLSPEEREKKFESIEFTVSGGASIAPDLMNELKKMLGLERSMQVYGMTETSPVTFLHPADNNICDERLNYVGKVAEHTEVKVVDENNEMVPFGSQGELAVRGYCNMLKYYGNEEKTKEIMGPDNWLRTGDQFILTEDGYGQVVGRIKDLIIRGGENIYPGEIENFLITHEEILEAYVYGVKDERMGEEIGASIRLAENSKLKIDDVKQFCKGKISHFKIPKYIEIVQDFPKTTSGKIKKFILKEKLEKSLGL